MSPQLEELFPNRTSHMLTLEKTSQTEQVTQDKLFIATPALVQFFPRDKNIPFLEAVTP